MKNIIIILIAVAIIIFLVHLLEGIFRGRTVHTVDVPVVSENISSELDGYKIAFVTDIHKMSEENLEKLAAQIEKENPKLILLGGDFGGGSYTENAIEILSGIEVEDGIYGVQGNHDNSQKLFKIMEEHSVGILDNSGEQIRPGLFVGGVADFWYRRASISKAVEDGQPNDFVLLVCHNADLTMIQSTKEVDLTLSGHTHGGEITFFGWAPVLSMIPGDYKISKYGQRFRSGWCKSKDDRDVYVSRGVGNYLGMRVFAPSELTILELKKA